MDRIFGNRTLLNELEHVDVGNDNCGFDILTRLEPFFEIAHQSIDVFRILNNSLVTLYSLEAMPQSIRQVPVNYSFSMVILHSFSGMWQSNYEVVEIARELCHDMESMSEMDKRQKAGPRKSIIDPSTC